MKAILLTTVAALVAAASLAAVARSAGTAQTVRVTETSYAIKLSTKPRPGAVKFVVRNAVEEPHDFWLRGGGKTWKTRILLRGNSATLTATLKPGVTYTYWCAIGSHRKKGMGGSFVAR